MSRKLKYPEAFKSILNIETGDFEMMPESKVQRQARLRRTSNARRAEALGSKRVLTELRKEALTMAWQLHYGGMAFPIHFDLVLSSGRYTTTERYSLVDAGFSHCVFDHDELVGSLGANVVRANRPKTVPPHFTHRP